MAWENAGPSERSKITPLGSSLAAETLWLGLQSPDARMIAAASLIWTLAEPQDASYLQTVAGKEVGSCTVKFPCPSFRSTAIGRLSHAVVTIKSRLLSPFTSRDAISRPPTGPVTPTNCREPALILNSIQYRAREAVICPIWMVARSGLLSPSKSAMAKRELTCPDRSDPLACGTGDAFPRPANPITRHANKSDVAAFLHKGRPV